MSTTEAKTKCHPPGVDEALPRHGVASVVRGKSNSRHSGNLITAGIFLTGYASHNTNQY